MARHQGRQRSPLPTADLHELAAIERLLRRDTRCASPTVEVGTNGARIGWETAEYNAHARGSLTASVACEIAHSAAWGLSTVHDPMDDDGTVQSLLTVVHAPEKSGTDR